MKRILVVDDQAYVREILCELLANEPGLAVAGAGADGREAVALADRLRPKRSGATGEADGDAVVAGRGPGGTCRRSSKLATRVRFPSPAPSPDLHER